MLFFEISHFSASVRGEKPFQKGVYHSAIKIEEKSEVGVFFPLQHFARRKIQFYAVIALRCIVFNALHV